MSFTPTMLNQELLDAIEAVNDYQTKKHGETIKRALWSRNASLSKWIAQAVRFASFLEYCDSRGYEFALFGRLERATVQRFRELASNHLDQQSAIIGYDSEAVLFLAKGYDLYGRPYSLPFHHMPMVSAFLVFLINSLGLQEGPQNLRNLLNRAFKNPVNSGAADEVARDIRKALDDWLTERLRSEHFSRQFNVIRDYFLDISHAKVQFTYETTPIGLVELATVKQGERIARPVALTDWHKKRWPRAYALFRDRKERSLSTAPIQTTRVLEENPRQWQYSVDNTKTWSGLLQIRSGQNEGFVKSVADETAIGYFNFNLVIPGTASGQLVAVMYSLDDGITWKDALQPELGRNKVVVRLSAQSSAVPQGEFILTMKSNSHSISWSDTESDNMSADEFITDETILDFWKRCVIEEPSLGSDLGLKLFRSSARSVIRFWLDSQASRASVKLNSAISLSSAEDGSNIDVRDTRHSAELRGSDADELAMHAVNLEWVSPLLTLFSPPCNEVKWLVGTDLKVVSEFLAGPDPQAGDKWDQGGYELSDIGRSTSLFGSCQPSPRFALTLARYTVFGRQQEKIGKSSDSLHDYAPEYTYWSLVDALKAIEQKVAHLCYLIPHHLREHDLGVGLSILLEIEPDLVGRQAKLLGISDAVILAFSTEQSYLSLQATEMSEGYFDRLICSVLVQLEGRVREALRASQRRGLRKNDVADPTFVAALREGARSILKLREELLNMCTRLSRVASDATFEGDVAHFSSVFRQLYEPEATRSNFVH